MSPQLETIYERARIATGKSHEELVKMALTSFGSILLHALDQRAKTIWTAATISEQGELTLEVDIPHAPRLSPRAPHPMDKDYLREAAKAISAKLPDNHGFILLVAPYGEDGRLTYIASIERQSAIAMLKEFLLKAGAAEDWMKHIE